MANIMLTDRCNLHCPYCFAHEFVGNGRSDKEITMERFHDILRFILLDGSERHVGLIGGEPTIHPHFGEFLQELIDDSRVDYVVVYTNGIELEKYLSLFLEDKVRLLVNCNSLEMIGESNFSRLKHNVELLARGKAHVTLGINVDRKEFDAAYVLPLLDFFQEPRLRFSLSIPQNAPDTADPLKRFKEMKKTMLDLFVQLKDHHVVPFFDCNFFPPCLFTAEEAAHFDEWGSENPLLALKSRTVSCAPVIDIMADGTAVRCFGLSSATKENIRDFATITDLRRYYMRTVDAYAMNCYYDSSCAECYKFKTAKCLGGCLAYKMKKVLALREMVEDAAKAEHGT
ncbi:MAG: radical SAM protein [Lachnospiraceae bacterium]|nr:radical SAM protein [Lachnospiraceae bacterium]